MDGILNIYKEAGWTSNDVVQKLRGILRTKKVGHGGTLDPAVTGVLPVAVGKATRLLEYMDSAGKIYRGEITLGFSTETEDATGALVERTPVSPGLTEAKVDQAMGQFLGKIQQIPPMYSAVKVNGRKLYEYARKGQTVERPVREVEIKELVRTSPLKFDDQDCVSFDFRVACSKGTYVRTLAVDLARDLGYAGHMACLQRTMANGLIIDNSKKLVEVENARDEGKLDELFLPMAWAVSGLERFNLSEAEFAAVQVGKRIRRNLPVSNEPIAVFYGEKLVGICQTLENELKPKKILI